MDDLYAIYQAKLAAQAKTIHPHRWLRRKAGFLWIVMFPEPNGPAGRVAISRPPFMLFNETVWRAHDVSAVLDKNERQSRTEVYMAQPEIAALYAEYVPDGLEIQNSIKDLMKERNPSLALEVHTPVGRADCVSIDTITEVAAIECWKAALGQVCAYRLHILRSHARIYLYGFDAAPRSLPWAVATCKHYDVCVSYELWERKRASRFQ